MQTDKPLVSLITVCFNSEKTIRDTIESILTQTYAHIEYIVVDGLSSDNTVSLARQYTPAFARRGFSYHIISEKDRGLYDAMNKGIRIAQGDIIGILNSDDYYINELVIEKVARKMTAEKTECLYADLLYVDEENTEKIVRKWVARTGDFRFGWNPPHPTTFIRKEVYDQYGLYKVEYKISSDYDLLYRILHKGKVKTAYLNEFIVKMRTGGRSGNGLKSNLLGWKEVYQTLEEHNQPLKLPIILIRAVSKIRQYQ